MSFIRFSTDVKNGEHGIYLIIAFFSVYIFHAFSLDMNFEFSLYDASLNVHVLSKKKKV